MKDKIIEFLKSNSPQICVLSTVDKNSKPESAVLVYTILDDFSVLVSTHKTSRKWINLQSNSHVALIFGGSFSGLNIQYEGTAELIESEEMYFTAHPETKMYKSEDTAFIKITPTWLRINDYTKHPPEVTELSF